MQRGQPRATARARVAAIRSPALRVDGRRPLARGRVAGGEGGGALSAVTSGAAVAGVDEHAGLERDELRRPPSLVATTLRSSATASSVAMPNGSASEGWHSTSHGGDPGGTASCGTRPVSATLGRPASAPRSGPSPTNARASRGERRDASASPDDVCAR